MKKRHGGENLRWRGSFSLSFFFSLIISTKKTWLEFKMIKNEKYLLNFKIYLVHSFKKTILL